MSDTEPRWYELRSAVFARDFRAAEELLRKNPDLLALRNGIGETVLHYLAVENAAEGVAWLHDKGADLDTKNEFGTPALFEVAQLGYEELFAWFVAHGANLGAVDDYGQGLVAFLAEQRKFKMARTALRAEIEAAFSGVARDPEQSLHQALPAYLCRSLALFTAPDFKADLLDIVLFQLTLRKEADEGLKGYLLERYRSLTPSQQEAVRHFLELVVQESLHLVETTNDHYEIYDAAKAALESYWDGFRTD